MFGCFHNQTSTTFQELSILQDIGDARGECKAHGNLGHVHLALGQHSLAAKCYAEQLEAARGEARDAGLEAAALGSLGVTRMNLGRHEEAIGCFEQQVRYITHPSHCTLVQTEFVFG